MMLWLYFWPQAGKDSTGYKNGRMVHLNETELIIRKKELKVVKATNGDHWDGRPNDAKV